MTELLEQAIARLKTLPFSEQDAIATMILEELEEERRFVMQNDCVKNEQSIK
jgi:hypothetical protein